MCSPSSKKLCGFITCAVCFPRSFASHARATEWSTKNPMRPEVVFRNSNKKFLFDCKECGHELEMSLNNINSGNGCVYCNRGKLCGSESCKFCFQQSMASHPMGAMWSERNKLSAREVSRGNDKKFWFRCSDCAHEYDSAPYSIKLDKHCPYCTNQKLCDEECKGCYEKSCAAHDGMREEWSAENEMGARQVFLHSNRKFWFDCKKCEHSYTNTPSHYYNRGRACPYCANIRLCESTECMTCFNKSFASHPRMTCWSPKNTLDPRMTFKGSNSRAYFECDKCSMEFDTRLYNVLTGYWCPGCKNKSELKVLTYLRKEYSHCKTQLRYNWARFSKTNNIMPFDFGLEEEKILIELDGIQHFEQVANWGSPEGIQEKDVEKTVKAVEAGYSVIHIFQPEVWSDEYDWKTVLKEQVEKLKERKEEKARCVFISRRKVYDAHISGLGAVRYEVITP
jgi:very-short-patch-repair endonuclease